MRRMVNWGSSCLSFLWITGPHREVIPALARWAPRSFVAAVAAVAELFTAITTLEDTKRSSHQGVSPRITVRTIGVVAHIVSFFGFSRDNGACLHRISSLHLIPRLAHVGRSRFCVFRNTIS